MMRMNQSLVCRIFLTLVYNKQTIPPLRLYTMSVHVQINPLALCIPHCGSNDTYGQSPGPNLDCSIDEHLLHSL